MTTALIVGGGIGGLAAAVALARVGVRVRVFEQAPALREAGAGLSLWSNATVHLHAWGLAAPLTAVGAHLQRGEICSRDGRVLAAVRLGELGREAGGPIVGIHRADLLNLLAAAVDPTAVRLDSRLTDFTQDDDGVTARFADGHAERGEFLVGADGIHSRTRELTLGDPQRYAGYVGWRGATRFEHPDLPADVSKWSYGRGGQFGLIQIGGGRVFWFGTATMPESAVAALGPHRDEFPPRFRDWHSPIPDLLDAIDPETIVRTPIYDRPPVKRWGTGRVTLLGDAAHATTPTLGQGACLAIEDAAALATCVCREKDVPTALREYERVRTRRTAKLIDEAWSLGKKIQWRNPLACWVRDTVIRAIPQSWHENSIRRIMRPGLQPVSPV